MEPYSTSDDSSSLKVGPSRSESEHDDDELGSSTRSFGTEDGDGNVDLAPKFTVHDENREMASLTVYDIVSSQSDLRGTAAAGGATTDVTKKIQAFRRALSLLPPSKTQAYRRAEVECSEQVGPERKAMFLEREDNNIDQASRRLARYWEYRSILFGNRCYLPMTLSGAMKEEVGNLATRKVFQLMPTKDSSGRAVIFISPARRNFAEYSVQQEAQALWYLLEVCMDDPEARKNGVVIVADGRDIQKKHYSRKMKLLVKVMGSVMPVRVRGIHLCYPSKVAYFIIYPVLKQIFGRHFRLRFKMHFGTQEKVLRELRDEYCLPVDRLPVELGGTVVLNMDQFLADRTAIENSELGIGRASSQEVLLISTRKSKRTREVKPKAAEITSSPPPPPPPSSKSKRKVPSPKPRASPTTSHFDGKKKEATKKSGIKGRRPDPRMARAVEARMSDPSLTLLDALVIGGYVFNDKKVDQDGTTLRQRTNNLCRRIRIEKERLAEEGNDHEMETQKKKPKRSRPAEEHFEHDVASFAFGQEDQESEPHEDMSAIALSPVEMGICADEPSDIASPVTTALPANDEMQVPQESHRSHGTLEAQFERNADTVAEESMEVKEAEDLSGDIHSGETEREAARRDSFLDRIGDLPGIDELDPFDINILAEDEEIEGLARNMLISE